MKLKKVLAMVLTAAVMITMCIPAFAAELQTDSLDPAVIVEEFSSAEERGITVPDDDIQTEQFVSLQAPEDEVVITLNQSSVSLYRQETFQLDVSVENKQGTTTFSSSDSQIASVNETGLVQAKRKGTAYITVENGGVSKEVKITVQNPALSAKTKTLYLYQTYTLKINGKVGNATFKSSRPTIATVNKKGKITAKKAGTSVITVKTNGVTLKCKVTVKKPKMSKKKLSTYNSEKTMLKMYGGKGKITWKSSNKKIAKVSSKGVITGIGKGTCTITAKRGKETVSCKVTVSPYYRHLMSVPDFGAMFCKLQKSMVVDDTEEYYTYEYRGTKAQFNSYVKELKKAGFKYAWKWAGATYYRYSGDTDTMASVQYKNGTILVQSIYDNSND